MSEILVLAVERPYASEAELLQQEAWTITKKSVFLIGVPPHPEGTLVRCQLVLRSGLQLLVAEGVVAKHMAEHGNRPSGLVVRFRRLSAASSQFVNRALSVRDATEASSPSAADNPPPSTQISTGEPRSIDVAKIAIPPRPGTVADALVRLASRQATSLMVPDDRESALARLRIRAAGAPGT
jgi:hypothetical protein